MPELIIAYGKVLSRTGKGSFLTVEIWNTDKYIAFTFSVWYNSEMKNTDESIEVICMKIKAAIFDMDGTLIDSLMLWDILWEVFGKKYLNGELFKPDIDTDKAIRTMPVPEAMEYLHKNCNIGNSGEELYKIATETFRNFYSHEVKLKKGVQELLDYFYKNGVKMCLATANDADLVDVVLRHCNVEKYFSKLFSCKELGKGKESPDVFFLALDYLGTPIEETWVFEDSYVALNTAVKAGFPTVGVYDKYSFRQDILRENSTIYISKSEDVSVLVSKLDAE